MPGSTEAGRGPPRRRRGADLERAILRAAVDELSEHGYRGLTMDKVAERAGTNKNAIYRRWPSRAALGVAAYRDMVAAEWQPPDTGSLRDDVLELLRRANRHMSSPKGDILRRLLLSVGDDPQLLTELQAATRDAGADIWLTIVARAVAQGEARPEAIHPRVATVAIVLLRNEYVTHGLTTVPDTVITEIVDEVYLPLVHQRA